MSVLPVGFGSSSGADVGDIDHSVRLRASASAYLSRTFGTPTDARKFTFNVWVKRGGLSRLQGVFGVYPSSGQSDANTQIIEFDANDKLSFSGFATMYRSTAQVFRDPTSAVCITVAYDSTQATASDREKIYIGGVRLTSFGTANDVALNTASPLNSSGSVVIIGQEGVTLAAGRYFDGYLSRICFVDGQALTPDSFGYLNTDINEWVSKTKQQIRAAIAVGGGTRNGWGANGCMENFEDATSLTTLGYDTSQADDGTGGNHWTCNNISLTAGVTYDHMLDVPGNSFATWSPIDKGTVTLAEANLSAVPATDPHGIRATYGLPSTGKYYWEVEVSALGYGVGLGIADNASNLSTGSGSAATRTYQFGAWFNSFNSGVVQYGTSQAVTGGANWSGASQPAANEVIMIAVDMDNGSMWVGKQGTWFNSSGTANPATNTDPRWTGLTGTTWFPYMSGYATSPATCRLNAGQAPLSSGATYYPAAGGSFKYEPPTGFLALNQANKPDIDPATLLDPTDHHIDIAVTKSGNTNFTLPWDASVYDTFFEIKRRDAAGDWYQIDGLRGYDKILKSNSTAAETTDANVLGVSGTTGTLKSTLADGTYIVSATKAGLTASRQTNTDGTITSTVSRNVDSGFAIVTFTTAASGSFTVGHGLGNVLAFWVTKHRDEGTYSWYCGHKALSNPATGYIQLNATAAEGSSAGFWGVAGATSTTLGLAVGASAFASRPMVAYCYADSDIQKSFSYKGNGSTDGPNPFLGFKCGRTLLKNATATNNPWLVFDSVRDPGNVMQYKVAPNSSVAENDVTISTISENNIDGLSNSIKPRTSNAVTNQSGQTLIGHAWAAVTGKYSLAR